MDAKDTMKRGYHFIKNLFEWAGSMLILAMIVFIVWNVFVVNNRMDVFMEDIRFNTYSNEPFVTIMDRFDPEGYWTYSEDGVRAMKKAGGGTATWHGHVDVMDSDQGPTREKFEVTIEIVFNKEEDTTEYEITQFVVDDGYRWNKEDDDWGRLGGKFMGIIMGESDGLEFTGYDEYSNVHWYYIAKPGTISAAAPDVPSPVIPDSPQTEAPDFELPTAEQGIHNLFGSWQDSEDNGNYIFIGYGDETKSQTWCAISSVEYYEFELFEQNNLCATGTVTSGSEPIYAVSLCRDGYRLLVDIYDVQADSTMELIMVPADPSTCPYENPFYID